MKAERITFAVSEDILASLKSGIADLKREIRETAAIKYYTEKKLSLGKAAKLAGINRLDFMDLLARQGITVFDLDESAAERELDNIKKI
jgi:predicted HTH domain antitoxin